MGKRLTPEECHRRMAAIRSTNTRPELLVRKLVHGLGYRFRLHRRDLPGKPDLVLPKYRKAIFVNGCFWHMHKCRVGARIPKTNEGYWRAKRARNAERDLRVLAELRALGWTTMTVWECETKNPDQIKTSLSRFIAGDTGGKLSTGNTL